MYLLSETPEEFTRLNTHAKEVAQEILDGITPLNASTKISSHQDVFSLPNNRGKLFLILEGTLAYVRGDKTLFYYDAGDIVGIEHFLTQSSSRVLSDFAVVVAVYDAEAVLKAVNASESRHRKWSEYLIVHSSLITILSSSNLYSGGEDQPPELRTFPAGEPIVLQGTDGHEVFTLVEGSAEVYVNGVLVGEILSGEIFGVFAALTNIPRTATVIAKTTCMALVLPRDHFSQLLGSNPATMLKMVEDMARTLAALNEQVVGLSVSKF